MRELFRSEDWWAVWIGLLVFILSLGVLFGFDLLGWAFTFREWLDVRKSVAAVSPAYAGLAPVTSVLLTFVFLLGILTAGAAVMGIPPGRFVPGLCVVFGVAFGCMLLGNFAFIAATPDKRAAMGIPWSVGLTGEAGYVLALLAGLLVANAFPRLTAWLSEAARPEWFIKAAIVILGAGLGVKAAGATTLARAVFFRGFAAIVEAYLIYWALVYLLARKVFRFSREWAAPLASGISICGVSAAIATGAAIRARPVVPVLVSSLVVLFAVVELLLLPFLAQAFLYQEPMVAGAWMGLAVKTDGAALASGAVTDALVRARTLAEGGPQYEAGWMVMATTTVKMFIDVFIGIWAFVLALVWVYRIDRRPGETVRPAEIWQRFPKFVFGYFLTFLVLLVLALLRPDRLDTFKLATQEADVFRVLFFAMTFFAIGLAANFRRLWQEGLARLAVVYLVSLFGFIIWIGLAISWVFFHGVRPPLARG